MRKSRMENSPCFRMDKINLIAHCAGPALQRCCASPCFSPPKLYCLLLPKLYYLLLPKLYCLTLPLLATCPLARETQPHLQRVLDGSDASERVMHQMLSKKRAPSLPEMTGTA